MTDVATARTSLLDRSAGQALGREIDEQLSGGQPDAVVVFASSLNDYPTLLRALDESCRPRLMIGCSSAGEFTSDGAGQGMSCVIAFRSPELKFSAALGQGIRDDHTAAVGQVVQQFVGLESHDYRYRTALVLVDALAGHADGLVEELTIRTAGTYQFFGGGAGDDAKFLNTHVFHGTDAYQDAVVALEILSNKPIGIGVRHGWQPASAPMRVTDADAGHLVSLNAIPAAEVFGEHAIATDQTFDQSDPLPFFLHNIIGVQAEGGHRLRVPLGLAGDGAVLCAAAVPAGATACIMSTSNVSAAEAASAAAREALGQLGRHRPKAAIFFDCVATRLRLGNADFGRELAAVSAELGPVPFVGCNTHGQIARAEGQFSGFHNCTAVVCVIPE